MSDTPLSTVQDLIEISLFEAIRLEIVDKGYLPDIADGGTYPDDQTGWDQWETDIKAIKDGAKGFAIEIFNGGSNQAKGVKKVPRIVLETGNFLPGALGGDPRRTFEDQGVTYKALITPPQTVDFYMNFCLVANTLEQIQILNSLLALSIPRRGYIKWYSDDTKRFFAHYLNYYDRSDNDVGLIEHVYAYEIPDAWDMEDREVDSVAAGDSTIAKINEITLNTNIQKYIDRTWGHDSDPLVIS